MPSAKPSPTRSAATADEFRGLRTPPRCSARWTWPRPWWSHGRVDQWLQDPALRLDRGRGAGLLRGAPRAGHPSRRDPRRDHRRGRHGVPRQRAGHLRCGPLRALRDGLRPTAEHLAVPGADVPRRGDAAWLTSQGIQHEPVGDEATQVAPWCSSSPGSGVLGCARRAVISATVGRAGRCIRTSSRVEAGR